MTQLWSAQPEAQVYKVLTTGAAVGETAAVVGEAAAAWHGMAHFAKAGPQRAKPGLQDIAV